jgi:putative membrane protein
VLLVTIAASAGLGIVTLAGTLKGLVETQRWVMYSLFIGLTLGGVPLVWRLARPFSPVIAVSAALAFLPLAAMALLGESGRVNAEPDALLFFVAGLLGSAAMILPGVSGGYLLLLLGQYEPILGAIEQLRLGLVGASGAGFAPEIPVILAAFVQLLPVGVGVVIGVVGVSNLVRWLLNRYAKATLGALLGLLFGAVVGLWPFQEGRPPLPGETVRGRVVTAANAADVAPKYWPVERFAASAGQVGASLALVLAGFGTTVLIGRLGHESASVGVDG